MRKLRYLAFGLASAVAACAVYDETLLGPGNGAAGGGAQAGAAGESPGGTSSAGAQAAAGTPAVAGAPAAAGAEANGGSSGEAGTPDEPSAGADGETGGTNTGGAAGASSAGRGGTNGGGAPAGGTGGGGTAGGGASSAGSPPVGDALVDGMQHTTASYANPPFNGTWSRAVTGNMGWVAPDVPTMFHLRADSTTDMSLRVAASCPASGTCASAPSDVEVTVTLNNGSAIDLSSYTGVSFYVNRVAGTGNILRVAIDDGHSHCSSGSQPDCGREVEYYVVGTDPYAISSGAWTKYKMPFSSFAKQCGWMCTRQNSLSLTDVYSFSFRVDRNISGGAVTKIDFDLDELYLYK